MSAINFSHLFQNHKTDLAERSCESLWSHCESELVKFFGSYAEDDCHGSHDLEILQMTSPPMPKLGGRHQALVGDSEIFLF